MGKLYMAPLEGVTGQIFRRCYHEEINLKMDGYMTPFISPNQNSCMNTREKKDVDPVNNQGIYVIPQILTKSAKQFVETATILKELGYQEVNLNLGCPSPTVTTKKKGAGMLADLAYLETFLDEIYKTSPLPISIKTRLGMQDIAEWEPLLSLYKKYPISQLFVHARLLSDFYGNTPNVEAVKLAQSEGFNICYNGDIFTVEDYKKIQNELGADVDVMLGRGILRNPFLSCEIMGQQLDDSVRKKQFWAFHDRLVEEYQKEMSGDFPVIQKMKELWSHMIVSFDGADKELKAIRKAKHMADYKAAVARLR